MSRTKAVFLGTASSQVYALITLLVSLFAAPIILKHLQAELYGLSIIIFQITAFLWMFDFGLTHGVQRFLAVNRDDNDESRKMVQQIVSTSFIVYGIIGFVSALTGILLAPLASKIFDIPKGYEQQVNIVIIIVSIIMGLQFLIRSISGIFFAHQKQILSNTLSFVLAISNTGLLLYFIQLGLELWSFIYTQVIVFVISSVLNIYFFKKHYRYIKLTFKDFDSQLLRKMFSFGFYIFLIGITVQIIYHTDRIIVGSMISLTAVSIYSFTIKIPELLGQIIWKITDNSFPGMVELSEKNPKTFREVHDKLMWLTLSLSTTGFWIILIASFPFIKLWVGVEYYAGMIFTVLVTYLYLIQHTFIRVSSICLNGAGIAKSISFVALAEGAFNLILSFILVKIYGLSGVIIATIISSLVTSFWYIPYLSIRYMDSSIGAYLSCLVKPFLICSVFDGLAFLIFFNLIQQSNTWLELIVYTGGYAFLCCIPLVLLNKKLFIELKTKIVKPHKLKVEMQPFFQTK